MGRIILNRRIFLLRRIALLLLCYYSCATLNNIAIPPDPIIGKWGLVSSESGGRPAPGNRTQPYSTVNVVFEFKPDNMLTIQRLQQNDYRGPWKSGSYHYSYIYGNDETMIRIDHTDWRCLVSENKLMIGRAHVGGINYFFERM